MSMEKIEFKKIDNISDYVKEGLKTGELTADEVAKTARIHARQGTIGEEIVTKMANGLEETKNTVKVDEKTGKPGWVVTNPAGEEYIVPDSKFQKKYELDPEDPTQYKPKGAPVLSTPIKEHIEFTAPWGEEMKIKAGGSLILNGPDDIYGIQKNEFESTYASTKKSREECLRKAMAIAGITATEILKAKQPRPEEKTPEDEQ